jgi:hypothetical protein
MACYGDSFTFFTDFEDFEERVSRKIFGPKKGIMLGG